MNPETHLKTNVLIVGQGVSGLILNYLLKQKGINTILLDRKLNTATPILAETIPPSTLSLLNHLGLLSLFEDCATKTYGYESKWNSDIIHEEVFFKHNPYKYGLKINKRKLLQTLDNNSQSETINYNKVLDIQYKNDTVITTVTTDNEKTTIKSDFIIDATGRKRAILKHLNIGSKAYDENLAFICYVPKAGPNLKYGFFTESFENGWGTISNLNETTDIITLYTTKNSLLHKQLISFSNWKKILLNTQILKQYLPSTGNYKIIGKQANSSKANKICSNNCLAVGDAAIAFSPVSSHGISNALFCASEASKAINSFYLTNDTSSFNTYENTLYRVFDEYFLQKEKLLTLEVI